MIRKTASDDRFNKIIQIKIMINFEDNFRTVNNASQLQSISNSFLFLNFVQI
jgi:hypothetical protein